MFQQLLDRKMLFRAPRAGPDRCREPHFRLRAGEPILSSERIDRRRDRSPEGQEAARKRHRNLKTDSKKVKKFIQYHLFSFKAWHAF